MPQNDLWQVVREDDNGNIYLMHGGISETEATKLADEFNTKNASKPHPHKQFYWAESTRPRLG